MVHVTAIGKGGDVETVAPETSYAYTASHTGALMRLAQIAETLGADLGDLAAVPDAVAGVLAAPGPVVEPPDRLLELMGAGPNAWTAAEGALKVREASYVATEGLSSEQFLHGPSVALDARTRSSRSTAAARRPGARRRSPPLWRSRAPRVARSPSASSARRSRSSR